MSPVLIAFRDTTVYQGLIWYIFLADYLWDFKSTFFCSQK